MRFFSNMTPNQKSKEINRVQSIITRFSNKENQIKPEDMTEEDKKLKEIFKQRRILRRYLRLKRNNYVKLHKD